MSPAPTVQSGWEKVKPILAYTIFPSPEFGGFFYGGKTDGESGNAARVIARTQGPVYDIAKSDGGSSHSGFPWANCR